MEKTAWSFFYHIRRIVVGHLLLEFVKITEPSVSKISQRENFSVDNLVETVDWPQLVLADVRKLNNSLQKFKKYVVPARNKLLAHYDKKTVLAKSPTGAFPLGEEKEFIKNLEELCNIFHKASFGSIFGHIGVSGPGDVLDLKKSLRRAIAFDRLFAESKGPELMKLFEYEQSAHLEKSKLKKDSNEIHREK
jgi:hypothetical protein